MSEEVSALQRQGTRSFVPSSPSQHVVRCKWVFKLKHNIGGSIAQHKARLIARPSSRVWYWLHTYF